MLIPLIVGTLLLAACGADKNRGTDPGTSAGEVRWYGAIKTIFEGDWASVTTLAEGLPAAHAYGLGALSDLRGEFLVEDGRVLLAYPTDTVLPRIVGAGTRSAEAAALLVTAEVPRWKEVPLRAGVSAEQLEQTVRDLAEANGVDTAQPFPFLLRGGFRALAWHVVDGSRVAPGMPPDTNAQRGTAAEADGIIVGFYSTRHQGVFTMIGQNVHMHVVLDDRSVVGHVGRVELAPGATLSLPH